MLPAQKGHHVTVQRRQTLFHWLDYTCIIVYGPKHPAPEISESSGKK